MQVSVNASKLASSGQLDVALYHMQLNELC